MKQLKNDPWTFLNSVYIYIISKHLKENMFEIFYLIKILNIYLHEKIWFDKLQHCLGKKDYGKHK
jgi:hypothetical protein